MAKTLKKFYDGHFEDDRSEIYTWILVYNADGSYRGQWQSNVVDDGPDEIFLKDLDGCVNGHFIPPLSSTEMAEATAL